MILQAPILSHHPQQCNSKVCCNLDFIFGGGGNGNGACGSNGCVGKTKTLQICVYTLSEE